jgi:hypothetical protein
MAGDRIELLVALGAGGHVAGLLEEGERGIDDAGARGIKALGLFLDGLDQVVAVPRLLLDEIERDEPDIAARKHAADAEVLAQAVPGAGEIAPRFLAETLRHALELAPTAFPTIEIVVHLCTSRYIFRCLTT